MLWLAEKLSIQQANCADKYEQTSLTDLVKELSFPGKNEFFYFGLDIKTGLSDISQNNPILNEREKKRYKKSVSFVYRFSLFVHALAFSTKSPFFKI